MGLRFVGNVMKPGYNPLAANITSGVNTVQHQGIFTLQQQARAVANQQWATDLYFDYTTLLIQADNAANGAQNNTFLDSSSNNFPITRNGGNPGMTQGTFSPFSLQQGEWSNFFDGSKATPDRISVPDAAKYYVGAGDFTIECYAYNIAWETGGAAPGYCNMIFEKGVFGTGREMRGYMNATEISIQLNLSATATGTYTTFTATVANNLNQWYHIAWVRNGNTWYIFRDGVVVGTGSISGTVFNTSEAMTIGGAADGNTNIMMNGYLSNFRIIIGQALATSAFAPPTSPLTTTSTGWRSNSSPIALTGTVGLLTCQSNRFLDTSANPVLITPTLGAPSVQAFSPFPPQHRYIPTVTGGSGYFDGTGDFLSSTSNITFGTNAFTIEFWWYSSNVTPTAMPFCCATNNALQIQAGGGNISIGTYGTGNTLSTSGAPLIANQWNHIVFVRSSTGTNGTAIFVNGSRNVVGQVSTNYVAGPIHVGAIPGGTQPITGYISGMVVTNGTANYSPTLTTINVPTAPPSPTGSTLTLNFTNPGILDGTLKNNLDTLNNSQVSTSVAKYGSGSVYFDGVDDYIVTLYKPNLRLGSDFTIEFWAYPVFRANTFPTIISNYSAFTASGSLGIFCGHNLTPTKWSVGFNNVNSVLVSSSNIVYNAWVHIAVVRHNGVMRMYVNGVLESSSAQTTAVLGSASNWWIGAAGDNLTLTEYNGYLDDLRVTTGIARYLGSIFTPPQVALPRQ